MKPPAVDDPITVLDETGKLLVHARWDGDGAHAYRLGMAGRVNTSVVPRPGDEGVTWCRGHVTDKDPEGKALLVSAALAPEMSDVTAGLLSDLFQMTYKRTVERNAQRALDRGMRKLSDDVKKLAKPWTTYYWR